ncbi:AI-2E family transporter [Novosphingobium sp.]|uniref:AI-2E family transporter n=1 Tax=Novosphingobium sp. TaxID=1874826 RepID=UPI0025D0DC37|nr:AI-2E family transporter [Novosphingobium sp.]
MPGFNDPADDFGQLDASDALQAAQSSARDMRKLLNIAAAMATVTALYFGKEVLLPITLAVILSFVLSPIVNGLQRLRLPRAPAAVLAVIATLATFGLVGTLIGSQAAALSSDAPQYVRTIEGKIQNIQGYAVLKLAALTKAFGTGVRSGNPPRIGEGAGQLTGRQPAKADAQGARRPVQVEIQAAPPTPTEIAGRVLSPVVGPLETAFIVLVVAIFILIQREDLRDRVIRLFGSADLHRTTIALDDAGQRLSKYFLSQFAVNTSFGAVIGVGLWLIGIPSPAMFGILAGLLRFVPYIGSFLAALAPMALGAAISPGWELTVFVALLFVGVDTLTGYVVEPLLYGHSTGLSPISVIVAAIFWAWLWGPVGLILSTPLTLCFVVLGRHIKAFEFFDVLLGDRPALSPVETFYQRILADNADEALAQAERMLGDKPLVDYYDSVIVQSLRLAAQDEARGTLDRGRLVKIRRLMLSVIEDLQLFQADTGTAHSTARTAIAPSRIVCVAGRGPFDGALATMFAQLLQSAGHTVRVVSYEQVARESIAALEPDGLAAIALIGLNPAGATAPIRHLIRRLRMHAPNSRILLGLWGGQGSEGTTELDDADWRRSIGADEIVASLREGTQRLLAGADDKTIFAPQAALA